MPKVIATVPVNAETRTTRPPISLEAREQELVALAMDCAEQQMRSGTASAQVICHYLKIGSTRDRLEREILAEQKGLVRAKAQSYRTGEELKEIYKDAMEALRSYQGGKNDETV